ncbi:MAG: SCO family protein [Anaerolineae bacterium]|nr:SCO family protein [Anaerolineae bacterium]
MHSGHGDIGGDEASATVYDPPHDVGDFTLTRHTGEPFRLSDLRGRMALLFFGFTHCPDVCPNTMATFVRVKDALGEQTEAVAFVFISVDRARDTPEVLAAYLDQFDPGFIGLTGDEADLRRIGEDYDLYFARRASGGSGDDYMVDHTAASFLLDQEGRLVMAFPYGTRAEDIAGAIAAR